MLKYIKEVFSPTWRMLALFIIALAITVTYILATQKTASTKDARVVTNVVPVAATVSGMISHINVADNQYVKKGQSLFELNSEEIRLKVVHEAARVAVLNQTVDAITNQLQKDRVQLVKEQAAHNKEKIDELEKNITLATVKLQQKAVILKEAQASYQSARNQMRHLVVTAPTSGYISNLNLHEGTAVKAYHTQFGIIQPAPVWVIANFLETELVRIRPGQVCRVRVTMYPGEEFEGEVESIGYGIAPDAESQFSGVLPTVAPDSSWVRLSQRFPVRIRVHNPHPDFPMRVGANAQVKVYTDR